MLPKSELDRVSDKTLENIIVLWRTKKYNPERGISDGKDVSTYKKVT